MDGLKPTEIVVSFSSLSYWNEAPVIVTRDEPKSSTKLSVRDTKMDRDSRLGDVPSETTLLPDANLSNQQVAGNFCTHDIVSYQCKMFLFHNYCIIMPLPHRAEALSNAFV